MKLFLIAVLSLLGYQWCTGYSVVESKLSKNLLLENVTSIESRFDRSNDSSPLDMHGVGKKVANKVKEGIKSIKNKVKGGFDKVKNKVKEGFDKVKNKIKDFKDKIGSKGGGGSGGGYYRDKYDRDYDRDRYNRDYYRKDRDYRGGSGISDPNAKWIGLGIGIFMIVSILGILIFFKIKGAI